MDDKTLSEVLRVIKYLPFDSVAQNHQKAFCMGYAVARQDFLRAIKKLKTGPKKEPTHSVTTPK